MDPDRGSPPNSTVWRFVDLATSSVPRTMMAARGRRSPPMREVQKLPYIGSVGVSSVRPPFVDVASGDEAYVKFRRSPWRYDRVADVRARYCTVRAQSRSDSGR